MTNRFLVSVAAAALIAGTGFANAQGAGGMSREGGSGSTIQHSAPPSGGGAAQRDAAEPKANQSEKAPGMKAEGREGKSSTVGQAPDKSGREDRMNAQGREDRGHMNAQDREGKEGKSGTVGQSPDKSGTTTTQGREDRERMNAPGQKGSTEMNRTQPNQGARSTTGNAATSATAAPPPEKRTQIVSAMKSERIEDVGANINVNVAVGARLPDTVRFYPLPPRIVEIYPQWSGYEVILIHGRYVIVQPQTREIVYVIEG